MPSQFDRGHDALGQPVAIVRHRTEDALAAAFARLGLLQPFHPIVGQKAHFAAGGVD